MKLRVWNAVNIGSGVVHKFDVSSPDEAIAVINALAKYQRTLPDNVLSSNTFGLQEFDREENEWLEWYSKDGMNIDEYEDSLAIT